MHGRSILVIALLVCSALLPVTRARAAETQCFAETRQCVGGRLLSFWGQNGGLQVLGFPIGAAADVLNRDKRQHFLMQEFERNRLEYHPEQAAPYDVLLGRLGDERLRQLGRDWRAEGRESGPRPGCLWFEQTGHNVCDQAPAAGFKRYWQTHGLADTRLDAYGRSLALFGLPLTAPRMETNGSGDRVLTQWFERARFEWHAGGQGRVLLGLLGNELHGPTSPRQPTRLIIPSIGLDYPTFGAGLDERRAPVVAPHDVAWYGLSATPGAGSNVVFWGHVLRFKETPTLPAPFARVEELRPGATLTVISVDGRAHRYRVTRQVQVTPQQVEYILPTGSERVTLISCIGDNVISDGTLTKQYRLVTIAEPY